MQNELLVRIRQTHLRLRPFISNRFDGPSRKVTASR